MPINDILMEIQRIGNVLRVCAMDAETGTEVVFQAPAYVGKTEIKRLAASKLQYVMKKAAESELSSTASKGTGN